MENDNIDITPISDLLKTQSADEICNDLAELAFNYAALLDEKNVQSFKNDIDTIGMIYHTFREIAK